MLSRIHKHTSLISKLILSGALIAVSLAYGWWQRQHDAAPAGTVSPTPLAATAPQPSATANASPPAPAPEAAAPPAPTAPAKEASAASTTPPLTAMAMLRMYQPPAPQPPLALVTGMPDPGATAPLPAGTHLKDGEYLSEIEAYEWGDLQVKITVQEGQIRAAVLTLYPDHRTESLDIS